MIVKSKKGNEKTIEIFVGLFLILAVAMVLLKMFSGQVADKSNELDRLDEAQSVSIQCGDLCSKAKTNNCRTEDLISYCVSKYQFDVNNDNQISDYDKGSMILCENDVYCSLEHNCVCGVELSMKKCVELTNDYYINEIGMSVVDANTTVHNMYVYDSSATSICNLGNDLRSWTELYLP